ncbi:unnamed protein product [Rhizophagus irregularis]|uniref:Uncharacterized protein n=1 Tax=Rhizophagus irregularis TaxID=588596 RepID=A0A915ZFZ8_9GLOM|nr:unnamed protein product [Rhizophagus irregularis]
MSYNKQMKNIIKPKKGYRMFNPKRSKDQQEIIEFTLDYQQHLRQRFGYTNDYEHASSDTSDDTKETSSFLDVLLWCDSFTLLFTGRGKEQDYGVRFIRSEGLAYAR